MPADFHDPKKKVQVEVIDELTGVTYEGMDYFRGDRFSCTPEWAAILASHGKVREVTEEPKKAEPKKDGGEPKK